MATMARGSARRDSLRLAVTRIVASGLAFLPVAAAHGQVIPVRVVPIAEADQFAFFPAANFGMGGVSIALADSLLDPFRNPAMAAGIRKALYFGSPTLFSVSNHAGSGQTLPVGALIRNGPMFFGGAVAVQQIAPARPFSSGFFTTDRALSSFAGPSIPEPQPSGPETNQHLYATMGRRFDGPRASIAASAMWSGLRAMEGVDLLFNGSHNVRQSGDRLGLRLGVVREWQGKRSLEAMVVHDRARMTYDVGYAQLFWDPATRQNQVQTFNVAAADGHRTVGGQLAFMTPIIDSAWRLGALVIANATHHQRAPYYRAMGVPRDAGYSNAYNVGVGVSRALHGSTVAFDAVFEPIWRRGSGRADTTLLGANGPLAPGAQTSDSYFKFLNVVLRGGASRDLRLASADSRLRLQFGAQLRNVNYALEHHDFLAGTFRATQRSWKEWTHGWGASFLFPRFEFGYQLRLQSGLGRIGVPPDEGAVFVSVPALDLTAPIPGSGVAIARPITIYPVRVTVHQLTFSVPLR